MYYIGADYHKDIAVVCIIDDKGKEIDTLELPATPEGMDILIERMGKKKFKILGEAFTYAMDLHNHLIGRGIDSNLVRPTDLKLITHSKKKTDRNDAATIAWYLRMKETGQIKLNYSFIPKNEQLEFRCICRLREDISTFKGKTSQKIKSHMRCNGEYLPVESFGSDPQMSTKKVQRYIIENFDGDFTLQEYLREYIYFEERTKETDREMARFDIDKEAVSLLQTIPGIGELSAMELMSMIVDIRRFPSSDVMRAYFGMAPRVRDSGETVRHGHVTKQGDSMMRRITNRIVQTHLMHCDKSVIRNCYESVKKRSNHGVARMAAANKLLDVIYSVLSNKRPYHS